MLVKFVSSISGELLMFADVAGPLLRAIGKETTARGAFTQDEMLAAAVLLRQAVARGAAPAARDGDEGEGEEQAVALSSRAWPFIDMLERSSRGGAKANIVWEAAGDF